MISKKGFRMRISVIIPCYNAGRWVADALRSVAQQSVAPYEIIVVDDGSTDNSVNAIQSSGVDVRLLHGDHRNAAAARNTGIGAAGGDWIAFLDADDRWLPNHLERASKLLQKSTDIAYLGHCVTFSDLKPQETHFSPLQWPLLEPTCGLTHMQFIEMYAEVTSFCMPSTLIRRDRLQEIGGFDVRLIRRHDIDMWLRAIAGKTWTLDPVPTVAYRRDTPGSISRSLANANYYHLLALLKNRMVYQSPAMERSIQTWARRSVASALTYGTSDDVNQALALARPNLSSRDRIALLLGRVLPGPFRFFHRWRNERIRARKPFNQ